MRIERTGPSFAVVLLFLLLCSCASDSAPATSNPAPRGETEGQGGRASDPTGGSPPHDRRSGERAEVQVPPDLRRLADALVSHAVGESSDLPHGESILLTIGGEPAGSIDGAALEDREAWSTCPEGWEGYAASSCPVDLLGPVRDAAANHAQLVYSGELGAVTCAPERTGRPPAGRVVVLRLEPRRRSCAMDFAIALVADAQGRLTAVDLTLSNP